MATWSPDPTFYPSPRMAVKAPPETLAYVAAFDPERKRPDRMAVVDLDPRSKSYAQIVGRVDMPGPGDELHLRIEVMEVRASKSRPEQGLVKVKTTTLNQNDEPVQVSIGNLVVPRRGARA